eukprot:1160540-Pelagomonas_calceolata.AAC.1
MMMMMMMNVRTSPTTAIAVIRCAEDGDYALVMRPAVPVHHQLVRAGNKVQAIHMVEVFADVVAKGVACASGGDAPSTAVVWI